MNYYPSKKEAILVVPISIKDAFHVIYVHGEGFACVPKEFVLDRLYFHGDGGKKMFFTFIETHTNEDEIKVAPKNLHLIKVTTQNRTNTKPAYVKLKSERFPENKAILLSYETTSKTYNSDIAVEWLEANGYPVVAIAEGIGCSYVLTNRFKPLVK